MDNQEKDPEGSMGQILLYTHVCSFDIIIIVAPGSPDLSPICRTRLC